MANCDDGELRCCDVDEVEQVRRFLKGIRLDTETIHAIPPDDKILPYFPVAPTFFRWSQGRPVTTNQVYGHSQCDYPSRPQPHRPTYYFDKIRPFSGFGFYPDMNDGAILCSDQTRSLPLPSLTATKCFCPPGTYNRWEHRKPYTLGPEKVQDRLDYKWPPEGFWLNYPVGVPKPPYNKVKGPANVKHMWPVRPDSLVRVVYHPQPPIDRPYEWQPHRKDWPMRRCGKFELP